MELSDTGKGELALAICLWKDFKAGGLFNVEISKTAIYLAKHLGIEREYEKMQSTLPVMHIVPKYPLMGSDD